VVLSKLNTYWKLDAEVPVVSKLQNEEEKVAGKRVVVLYLVPLLIIAFVVPVSADLTSPTLVFRMSADDTTLTPGQATTVHVWTWIYDTSGAPQPDNGLDSWAMDLDVDNTGVIQISDINLLAPDPDWDYSGWNDTSLNNPVTGEVRELLVNQEVYNAPSYVGVGVDADIDNWDNYTEIFYFTIQADMSPSASTATYTLTDDGGGLFWGVMVDDDSDPFNDREFENGNPSAYGGVYFYGDGSDNVFTIVPEPSSLLLLAGMAGFGLSRRRRK